ncbi:MAG: hypothetical protein PHQ54_05255 [Candidatus Omnitrophica bacterium]|nr:hypothetical protein [Candidatus Omnitrophota bacterium]
MVLTREAFIANFKIIIGQYLEKKLPESGEESFMIEEAWKAARDKTRHIYIGIRSANGGSNGQDN